MKVKRFFFIKSVFFADYFLSFHVAGISAE